MSNIQFLLLYGLGCLIMSEVHESAVFEWVWFAIAMTCYFTAFVQMRRLSKELTRRGY